MSPRPAKGMDKTPFPDISNTPSGTPPSKPKPTRNCIATRPKKTFAFQSQKCDNRRSQEVDRSEFRQHTRVPCQNCAGCFRPTFRFPQPNFRIRSIILSQSEAPKVLNSTYSVPVTMQQTLRFSNLPDFARDKTTEFCPKTWDPYPWDKTPKEGGNAQRTPNQNVASPNRLTFAIP